VDTQSLDFNFTGVPVLGDVVDNDTGRPVAQAYVWALKRAGQGSAGSGTTGSDGRFQLELDPGEYRIQAELRESDYGKAESDVTVTASGAPELRLSLPRGLSLSGKVVDTAGRPASGVLVLASSGTGPGRSFGASPTRTDGTFKIGGLAPQAHSLVARSNLGTVAFRPGVAPGSADTQLVLRPGARVRLEVLGPAGAPAEGAYASVESVDGGPAAGLSGGNTDSQGLTEIVAPAGRVVIRARKEDLEGRTTVTLTEAAATTAQVRLTETPKQEP
jgi:hypothetical protein